MSAAYKAYLLTAALKIHRSAGALSRGRAVIQTKGEEGRQMNANNVWVDSTGGEEVVEARFACVVWCQVLCFGLMSLFFFGTHRDVHTKLFAVGDTALLYYSP